jgi:hypothetical protein
MPGVLGRIAHLPVGVDGQVGNHSVGICRKPPGRICQAQPGWGW